MVRCTDDSYVVGNYLFRRRLRRCPPVDIDGIREPVAGSLMYGNNIISGAVVPSSNTSVFTSIPSGKLGITRRVETYNGGPFQLVVFHFLIGIYAYMGREWELSYRLGMRPWICVASPLSVMAAQSSWSILSVKVLSLTFPWVSLVHSTTCWSSKLKQHPDAPPSTCWESFLVSSVVHCSPRYGSLVTSSLVRETTENESQNYGYKFGQEEETYNIVAHWLLRSSHLPIRFVQQLTFPSLLPGSVAVIGIWFTALGVSTMAFNLNGFNFNQSIVESQGKVINTWADVLNRAGLGMEVMHERNAS